MQHEKAHCVTSGQYRTFAKLKQNNKSSNDICIKQPPHKRKRNNNLVHKLLGENNIQGGPLMGPSLAKPFVSCDEEASHETITFWMANLDFDKVVHLRDQPLRNQHIKVVHSWDHRLHNHL